MGKHQKRKQGIENKYPTWPFVGVTSHEMNCVSLRVSRYHCPAVNQVRVVGPKSLPYIIGPLYALEVIATVTGNL